MAYVYIGAEEIAENFNHYKGPQTMNQGKRVGIVGAGNVGATVAYSLAMLGSCHEIILRDNKIDVAKGKALDMSQAAAAVRSHTVVSVAESMEQLTDCDVVVVTAGSPRLPGMSRDDLLMINAKITKEVIQGIAKYSPNAIVIMVSNPLDAMTYVALRESGFDRNRVLGMAGILDSSRMASFIQEKLGYGGGQIRASVMGGHGDDMVPLPRYSTVAGVPLTDVLTDAEIEEIVERTRHGGAEIVGYLKTGSAYYAPAKSTAIMVEAILKDTKQIHPCAVYLEGEYGYSDVVSGVPVMIGANGAEKIIEVTLNEKEKAMFAQSCNSVQRLIDTLNENKFFEEA
jgi:malate dehydrogenase